MAENLYFEEEEFSTQFNGQTIWRILKLGMRHWPLLAAFLGGISMIAFIDSYFTYLRNRIIDEWILAGDLNILLTIIILYGSLLVVQAAMVFAFIYMVFAFIYNVLDGLGNVFNMICGRRCLHKSRICLSPILIVHPSVG